MSAVTPRRGTRPEVDRLVDERPGYTPRYELVDGELLVTPAPSLGATKPILICETLSSGSSRHDRITKRRAFQRNEVPDYWIVDGDAEVFEVWHPADERPEIIDEQLTWLPVSAPVPFKLDVREFFASVADGAELK